MHRLYTRIFMVCLCCYAAARPYHAVAQRYATKVFDFKPAPGQFTNTGFSTPEAAQGVRGPSDNGMVSLGGFGGYIVVGFDAPVPNDPQNPYGVDFTVNGNAFPNWAEPGAVMVMKDDNKNGLPDDTWYELAGSEYHFTHSQPVAMTYFNPFPKAGRDVPWEVEGGRDGAILTNIFNTQPYYPQPEIYQNVDPTHERYTGRMTTVRVDRSYPFLIYLQSLDFGYADNKGSNPTPHIPTNPYRNDDRGASSDGFDIAWAVDANGNYVTLDQIDFVKIYNPAQADAGWVGESSPEIEMIAVTTPDPSWKPVDYSLHVIGSAPLQVIRGKQHTFEGLLFKNGIPQPGAAHWSVSDPSVGTIDQNGVFTALANDTIDIQFYIDDQVPAASFTLQVVDLLSLDIHTNEQTLYVGERGYIYTEGIDNRDEPYNHFAYDSYTYQVSDASILSVSPTGVTTALAPGTVTVTVTSQSDAAVSGAIEITVLNPLSTATPRVVYPFELGQSRIDLDTLISFERDAPYSYTLVGIDKLGITDAVITEGHYLDLSFAASKGGVANVALGVNIYGHTYALPLEVTIVREDVVTGLPHEPVVRSLYPNPVKDILHVAVTALPASLDIIDTYGNRMASQVLTERSDTSVDVQALPAGVYVLTLHQGTHIVRKKIVKE